MDRRNFVESTLVAGAALTGVAPVARAAGRFADSSAGAAPREFKLRYAPHFQRLGMQMGVFVAHDISWATRPRTSSRR